MRSVLMPKIVAWSGVSILALLLMASPVSATPIGNFAFDVSDALGPFFTVENNSGGPWSGTPPTLFTDVVIHLFSFGTEVFPDVCCNPDGTTFFAPLVLNPFDLTDRDLPADGLNTRTTLFTDLSATIFDTATLSFGFALPGSVGVAPLNVLAILGCHAAGACTGVAPATNAIEFTAAAAATPVPEPTTLLLVGGGLLASLRQRRRRA
jgi:hypothetical protein